jgi:pimeloyl-ACP methyl ester carboxylesterase
MSCQVLLLPGLDGTGAQFGPLVAQLGNDIEPIVVSYPTTSTKYEEHVAQVLSLLPKTKPYVIVAESYSGPVAIQVAATKPPGLIGVVLCATFAKCPSSLLETFGFLLKIVPPWRIPAEWVAPFALGKSQSLELLARLREALAQVPPLTLLDRLKCVSRVDVSKAAAAIEVPVVYLQAAHDRLVPAASAVHLATCIRGLSVRVLDGPHFLLQANATAAALEVRSLATSRAG